MVSWMGEKVDRLSGGKGDTHGVLVVVETDLFAQILGVRAIVDDTLGIVNIAVGADAPGRGWIGRHRDVEHEEAAFAAGAARRTDRIDHVLLLVGHNIVRGSETTVPSGQIVLDAEGLRGPLDG